MTLATAHLEGQSRLIYVGDPMCSWCYGISAEIQSLWDSHPDIDKEIVMGGLRIGGGEEWSPRFRDFLRHHWEEVSTASGAQFSYDLLDRDYFDYDTEPACRAVVVARQLNPDKELDFFREIQSHFYKDGHDPGVVDFYKSICSSTGIDYQDFIDIYVSEESKALLIDDLNKAAKLGARSFPTVILYHADEAHVIAQGYSDVASMKRRINQILN